MMDVLQRAQHTPLSRIEDAKNGSRLNYSLKRNDSRQYGDGEVMEIFHHLLRNKRLESLVLDGNYSFNFPDSWKALGELVCTSTSLKCVSLLAMEMDAYGLRCIVDGILGNPGCTLEALFLSTNLKGSASGRFDCSFDPFAKHLSRLLRDSRRLRMLYVGNEMLFKPDGCFPIAISESQEEMELLAEGLVANTTLMELGVSGILVNHICKALTPPDNCSQSEIRYNKTLQRLHISCNQIDDPRLSSQLISKMLQKNYSLRELYVRDCVWEPEYWVPILNSLRSNKNLQKLALHGCSDIGDDDVFDCLLGLLHVNFTMEIELDELTRARINSRHRFERRRLIELQLETLLKRNRQIAKYMRFFSNLKSTQPKLGRLFLCGAPYAGKTTLRRSMVNSQAPLARRIMAKSASLFGLRGGHDERTQGIEIRTLQRHRDSEECVAIWDMAGQDEYRALHDSHYLFPEIHQGFLFLFVFQPMDMHTKRFDSEVALCRLKKELRYWLTFINSNLRKAAWQIPQISVVLTHLDEVRDCFSSADKYVDWARAAIDEMRDCFSGRVEVHQTISAVDSRSQRDARGVVDHLWTSFGHLFTMLPRVPDICQKLSFDLVMWNKRKPTTPILTSHRFFELCQQMLFELHQQLLPDLLEDVLEDRSSAQAVDIRKQWQAIVSYLHDVGWIVKFETLDCIVVDVNWLGRDFLGALFNSESLREYLPPSKHGIVEVHRLERFLKEFIVRRKYKDLEAGTLIQLMKELKICEDVRLSQRESSTHTPRLFMPSILDDDGGHASKGTRHLGWSEIQDDSGCRPVYYGFRLLCVDSTRTFLSPGLFLRYQIHLLRTLSAVDSCSFDYELERNLIRVKHDGIEMLIESSGELDNADYVDILIRIVGPPGLRKQYAYEKGVTELRQFCASGDGCPGVTLQEAFIRPECVEKLTLCKNRRNQAVTGEELKTMLLEKVQQGLGETQESWIQGDYKHRFEAVDDPKGSLPEAWVEASELTDVAAIIEQSVIDETIDEIQRIDRAFEDLERMTNPAISSGLRAHKCSTCSTCSEETSDPELCQSHFVPQPVDNDSQTDISITMKHFSHKLDLVLSNQNVLMKASQVQQVKQEVLMEKLHQIYHMSQLQYHLPRIPYFTDFDSTFSERIISHIKLGRALRLHFMCEEPRRIHFIKDQSGLAITIPREGDLYKNLRPLVWASFKMLYILVKSSTHVGAGIGELIPGLGEETGVELKALFLTGEAILNEIKTSAQSQSNFALKNAWDCLVDEVVAPRRHRIPESFGLYRVVYKASYLEKPCSTSVHWICAECREKAQRAGRLEIQNEIKPGRRLSKSDLK